ncbi:MAG: hypothetical protein ERJ69_02840 [Aphanocapsa feldmannii 288cV]|nr:MAG: hypothetical protein ERJ69_02840 [Aphanocapsa feldmannii 288cV]
MAMRTGMGFGQLIAKGRKGGGDGTSGPAVGDENRPQRLLLPCPAARAEPQDPQGERGDGGRR